MSASSSSLLVNATLDDFASAFSYSSAWTAPDTSARGYPNGDPFLSTLVDGTYHAASSPNQTTALSFSGSAVYLYGVAGPSQGFYSLTLDGRSTSAPLSAFASSNISNTLLWSASDLSSDPHTLEITNLGQNGNSSVGNAFLIDYALVTSVIGAEEATVTNTTVEDTDARLVYEGSWDSNEDTRFSGNVSTYTNEALSVSLKFNGSAAYVYGDTVNDHGLFTVALDGTSQQFQGYTDELKIGTLKYFAGGLNASEHTLTITNNPGSDATFFDLDSIVYTTPSSYATEASDAAPSVASSASIAPSPSSSITPSSAAGRTTPAFTAFLLLVAALAVVGSA